MWVALVSGELIALAFFDQCSRERATVDGLSEEGKEDPPKRISLGQSKMPELRLCDFVTANTRNFFKILDQPDFFLEVNPEVSLKILTIVKQKTLFESFVLSMILQN